MNYIKKIMPLNTVVWPMLPEVNKYTGQKVTMLSFPKPVLIDENCDKSLKITLSVNCFPWMEREKGTFKVIAYMNPSGQVGYTQSLKVTAIDTSSRKLTLNNWIGSSIRNKQGSWKNNVNNDGLYPLFGLGIQFTQASAITQAAAGYELTGSIEYYELQPLSGSIINILNEKLADIIPYSIN